MRFVWCFEKSCSHLAGDKLFFGMPDESKGCGTRRMSMSDIGKGFQLTLERLNGTIPAAQINVAAMPIRVIQE